MPLFNEVEAPLLAVSSQPSPSRPVIPDEDIILHVREEGKSCKTRDFVADQYGLDPLDVVALLAEHHYIHWG